MLTQIGAIAERCDISARTLRYWEEAGILTSTRMENGYRCYDEANVRRVNQIVMLRKLRLPIPDIHRIFLSRELSEAIAALERHLAETRREAADLEALGRLLERLVSLLKRREAVSGTPDLPPAEEDPVFRELQRALQITLSERETLMSEQKSYAKVQDVRLIRLPKMVFACYCAESQTPEHDCAAVMNAFIAEHALQDHYGFRHFGFNNPDPREGDPVYGYEMWAAVPPDLSVPEPLARKEFEGGLFAAIPTGMTVIGEQWRRLWQWAQNSGEYEVDWQPEKDRRWLEECIEYVHFNAPTTAEEDKQLDLLLPVKRRQEDGTEERQNRK